VFVTWKGERERSGRQAMLLTVGPDMFLLYEADRSGPWSLMIRLLLGPLDRAG
jgi:hypothetical protein